MGEPVHPPRNKAQGAPPTTGESGRENEQTETGLRNSLTPGLTPSPPHLIDPHFTFLRPNLAALLAFIAHRTLACRGPVPLQASLRGLPAPSLLRRHLGDLGPLGPPLWGLVPQTALVCLLATPPSRHLAVICWIRDPPLPGNHASWEGSCWGSGPPSLRGWHWPGGLPGLPGTR